MIERAWDSFRHNYCPKRIYRYGTVGLSVMDDRTALEKICDRVDNWLYERRQANRYEKAYRTKARWHSFYSMCLGGIVDSPDKIRAWERKGYAWATSREFEQTASKAQARIKVEQDKKIRDKVYYAAQQIKQGRSYLKEQREAIVKAGGRARINLD